MSFETHEAQGGEYPPEPGHPDDGRTPLALVAGLVAAIAAGAMWAGLVFLTDREIGWVAWGVGLLVGFAMSRVTARRTRQLAYAAALFALLGLAAGKVFIYAGGTDALARQLESDELSLSGAYAWQLYAERQLAPETLAQLDALQTTGDTLSDALWEEMRAEAGERIAQLSDEEKHGIAIAVSESTLQNMGVLAGVRAQLSLFDLLWAFLAVSTAFRMLAPAKEQPVPEPAVTV